jgi:carboxypeptidase D
MVRCIPLGWIYLLVLLDATLSRVTGFSARVAIDLPPRPSHEDGGDANPEERLSLPYVDNTTRLATEARFEELLSSGTDERGLLTDLVSRVTAFGKDQTETPLDIVTSRYLTNEEVLLHLRDYTNRCGNISRVVRLGTSVQGVPIEALEISDTVQEGLADGKPHVKIVGTIHGDETSGLSTSLGMAEWLCANYQTDALARDIVSSAHVWVLPVMNPDGYAMRKRYNANGKDLNRDFPDQFKGGMCDCTEGRQPETKAIMEWTADYPFVSSLVFHEGALVVNYPMDGTPSAQVYYNAAEDDETFVYLARTYADNHPVLRTMRQRSFSNGITNGASWYVIYGGMQDWNYLQEHVMELTIEANQDKSPPASELRKVFDENRQSILEFIRATTLDVLHGQVTSESNKGIKGAKVMLKGINSWVETRENGYYTRPVVPGTYTMTVEKQGFRKAEKKVKVMSEGADVNVKLRRKKKKRQNNNKKKQNNNKKKQNK